MKTSQIGLVHWDSGRWQDSHEKGNKKGKVNGLKVHMPSLSWELLFSMLCLLCMNKGSSLNIGLMLYGNYAIIMITLIFIYVYMYVCISCLTGSSWTMIV